MTPGHAFPMCCLMFSFGAASITPALAAPAECVILVHGLNRSERSMMKLQTALQMQGYATTLHILLEPNPLLNWPSRT